jgi:hypothetical protein
MFPASSTTLSAVVTLQTVAAIAAAAVDQQVCKQQQTTIKIEEVCGTCGLNIQSPTVNSVDQTCHDVMWQQPATAAATAMTAAAVVSGLPETAHADTVTTLSSSSSSSAYLLHCLRL